MTSVTRAVAAFAVLALVAFPATAAAVPPTNDHYVQSQPLNAPGTPLAREFIDTSKNTTDATVQGDLFNPPSSGGPPEPTACVFPDRTANYGKTVWYDIYPHVNGFVNIEAAGFDAVIGIVPFDQANSLPDLNAFRCVDNPTLVGNERLVTSVSAGSAYTIQVGGFSASANLATAAAGPLEFTLDFFPDRDGDGVFDDLDACPDVSGGMTNGCPTPTPPPDTDRDGVRDSQDACPTAPGPVRGCPDSDGDGIPDIGDKCGAENSRARDKNGDGCLDTLRLDRDVDSKLRFSQIDKPNFKGIRVRSLVVTGVASGATVRMRCRRPRGRSCGRRDRTARTTGPVPIRRFRPRLRAGTILEILVTHPKGIGKYFCYRINRQPSGFRRTARPITQGSRSPRPRCR